MIFSVQRFLEDHLNTRNLVDVDQYAVRIANLYDQTRSAKRERQFLASMGRIRTVLFRNNPELDRATFERDLLRRLDDRFKKKIVAEEATVFPRGVSPERRSLLRAPRRNIRVLLNEFRSAVEARAVDSFWTSRKRGELRPRPEKIAQALLAVFAKASMCASNRSTARRRAPGPRIAWVAMHCVS